MSDINIKEVVAAVAYEAKRHEAIAKLNIKSLDPYMREQHLAELFRAAEEILIKKMDEELAQ